MSSFLVFDFKRGEFERPKASLTPNKYQIDKFIFSSFQLVLNGGIEIKGELVRESKEVDYEVMGRLRSIMPHKRTCIQWQGQDKYSKFSSFGIF